MVFQHHYCECLYAVHPVSSGRQTLRFSPDHGQEAIFARPRFWIDIEKAVGIKIHRVYPITEFQAMFGSRRAIWHTLLGLPIWLICALVGGPFLAAAAIHRGLFDRQFTYRACQDDQTGDKWVEVYKYPAPWLTRCQTTKVWTVRGMTIDQVIRARKAGTISLKG